MGMFDLNSILNPVEYFSLDELLNDVVVNGNVLLHGSNEGVPSPKIKCEKTNPYTDFGIGFYLTSFPDQAEDWAKKKAGKYGGRPTVSVYDYDGQADEYDFGMECTAEWIQFVKEGRNGRINWDVGDVVIGRVADDRNYDAIIDFVNDRISLDDVMEAIEYGESFGYLNDQFCFKKQNALDSHLLYLGEYYV